MLRFYSRPIGGARVSVMAQHSEEEGMLKVAVARCSNKDQFVKRKGRAIAEGRLAKGKTYTELPMVSITGQQFYDIAEQISKKVAETKLVY